MERYENHIEYVQALISSHFVNEISFFVSQNNFILKIWEHSPMDMATASIRTFIKWKKYRGKWSPNILADYCWILIRNKLAKVKYKR